MPNLRPRIEIAAVLWDALRQQPFEPFTLRLHNGELLSIDNPDVLTVTLSSRVIYDSGEEWRMLNPMLIASVDFPSTSAPVSN